MERTVSGSCVVVSAWSSCIRLVTALRRVSLVWMSVPLLQLNLPCHYCSRAACLPHCPWMADVRLPALFPPKDDWNVGEHQKLNVIIQSKGKRVFERSTLGESCFMWIYIEQGTHRRGLWLSLLNANIRSVLEWTETTEGNRNECINWLGHGAFML